MPSKPQGVRKPVQYGVSNHIVLPSSPKWRGVSHVLWRKKKGGGLDEYIHSKMSGVRNRTVREDLYLYTERGRCCGWEGQKVTVQQDCEPDSAHASDERGNAQKNSPTQREREGGGVVVSTS